MKTTIETGSDTFRKLPIRLRPVTSADPRPEPYPNFQRCRDHSPISGNLADVESQHETETPFPPPATDVEIAAVPSHPSAGRGADERDHRGTKRTVPAFREVAAVPSHPSAGRGADERDHRGTKRTVPAFREVAAGIREASTGERRACERHANDGHASDRQNHRAMAETVGGSATDIDKEHL